MSGNRQLNVNDYLMALRRRLTLVVIFALTTPLLAYGASFLIPARYTSRSLVQVAAQVLPAGYVKPIVTERLADRVAGLQQRVLTQAHLLPMVERLGLATKGQTADAVLDLVRSSLSITPAEPGTNPSPSLAKKKLQDGENVPGFYVNFTWNNARQAQQACSELTSMLLDENLKARQQIGQSTTEFLARQLEQAKHNLDALDGELATFKQLHLGRLPGDVENNLKILSGLDSQLDANTQGLSRAQQEKSFAESLLTQELAAWKSSQESPNLPSLREELITLQNQLVSLQSRYTEQHPDVLKVKNDIVEIKRKLNEVKQDSNTPQGGEEARAKMEPPAILSLRERIHQQDSVIERATAEQTRLKQQIASYQGRLALSPEVEEEYKKLTRDNETAHTIYDSLLANKNSAEMQTEMEREQQGEQIKLLESANFPLAPSFPARWMFAAGGLVAGLGLSVSLVIIRELLDRSIRDETDVAELLNLPTLAFVPSSVPNSDSPDLRDSWRNRIRPAPAK
jgi:uncharacterized protein involved in exopolysaccharide biosynthesis